MIRDLRILFISDVHLGHLRTPTEHILKSIKIFFNEYKNNYTLDGIVIGGDLFDRLLDYSSYEAQLINIWISIIMEFCSINNIKLRILEGTRRHDRAQSKNFDTINAVKSINIDYKYIDTLSIEYISDWDLYVLYVPDEWRESPKDTYNEVLTLLKDNNLTEVDIAVMHGCFDYQLPGIVTNVPKHNSEDYLKIVRHYISIGHIHSYSAYNRIFAQGSFDRLAHNEEEPKGGVLAIISENPDNSIFFFIENKNAYPYITLNMKHKTIESAIEYLSKKLKKIPEGAYVRLRLTKDSPFNTSIKELERRFPHVYLSKIVDNNEIIENNNLLDNLADVTYTPIVITPNNIKSLIQKNLEEKNLDAVSINRILDLTNGIV